MNQSQPNRREFLSRSALSFGLGGAAMGLAGRGIVDAAWQDDPASGSADALMARAVTFLKPRQAENGAWSADRNEPGISALVVAALLKTRRVAVGDPAIAKGLEYLEQFARPEGGFDGPHANYTTAIALMAYQEANAAGGRYDAVIQGGQTFLKEKQWDEGEGKDPSDPYYGGAGYGGNNSRPDLSNTTFMIEALHETGLPPDDPALQKAIAFLSRCQNLQGEFNDQPWADKVNDGGFVYTAANGGSSVAGPTDNGGLRSYGSMTYAGFKSLIYAGLTQDDPRVAAALDYIKRNYTLDENPGLGEAGLYYYYQAFAKAMSALGQPTFTDAAGKSHDWRAELIAALAKRQSQDGGWVNPADRFMEGDPNLVTAYALIALANTLPAKGA